jgi:uncharacterized protein
MLFWDSTMPLLIPALILALWSQWKVKSTYAKWSQVPAHSGLTGAGVAELILRDEGIAVNGPEVSGAPYRGAGQGVILEAIPGQLTDHYDSKARTLRLSEDVYYGNSIAALGIAAHEVGHAVQHAKMYSPLALRNVMYPVSSLGSTLAWPLFILGFIVRVPGLINIAIVLFTLAVFFTVITLPVEFNASRRALRVLGNGRYLTTEELSGARAVLTAAALTYVASALMAVLQLVRMFLISRDR